MHITKDNWKNLQEFAPSDGFKMHSQSDFQKTKTNG
jgi:hypothetical protein